VDIAGIELGGLGHRGEVGRGPGPARVARRVG